MKTTFDVFIIRLSLNLMRESVNLKIVLGKNPKLNKQKERGGGSARWGDP